MRGSTLELRDSTSEARGSTLKAQSSSSEIQDSISKAQGSISKASKLFDGLIGIPEKESTRRNFYLHNCNFSATFAAVKMNTQRHAGVIIF
jgi:hypothetical protein